MEKYDSKRSMQHMDIIFEANRKVRTEIHRQIMELKFPDNHDECKFYKDGHQALNDVRDIAMEAFDELLSQSLSIFRLKEKNDDEHRRQTA